eukprot:2663211-Heterocapsa_arctica.AAC.1
MLNLPMLLSLGQSIIVEWAHLVHTLCRRFRLEYSIGHRIDTRRHSTTAKEESAGSPPLP